MKIEKVRILIKVIAVLLFFSVIVLTHSSVRERIDSDFFLPIISFSLVILAVISYYLGMRNKDLK